MTKDNRRFLEFQSEEWRNKFYNKKDKSYKSNKRNVEDIEMLSVDNIKANDALLFFTPHEYSDYRFNQKCTPVKKGNTQL